MRRLITPGDALVEAPSGNTAIAPARVAAMRGYPRTLIIPDNISHERLTTMGAFGADIILATQEEGIMNVLVFDIETIPDIDGCRRLYDLHGLSDDDVARAVFQMRRQQSGNEFLRHYLHRIVAISAVLRTRDQFKVWSLGDIEANEQDLLQRFYSGIERYSPRLVSWNGSGFDLPVIHYRSLLYPINAAHYWETGQNDTSFRYNNYLSRFHERHTDLMDVLAAYQPRASAPLDEIAGLCGFPGKMGMSGSRVWDAYQQGQIKEIRDYCETDVLNTYLVFLNFERSRGNFDQTQYLTECQLVRDELKASGLQHLLDFEAAWHDV